jgi:Na+-driven multidrug efflux pump
LGCRGSLGGFVFVGALFVSNAAFNNLGKPGRSAFVNWIKDGVLSWPLAMWLSASFGAAGVIYGQAAAGVVMGALAALWGWRYVAGMNELDKTALQVPRPYPNTDRYRSR